MAPASSSSRSHIQWRPTKIMNMRDLSKDDDFLSHLLVEKLGTGLVPLLVHKMDPTRRLPKTDANDLLTIVRRLVATKGPIQHAARQAVDDLLGIASIRYYLKSYSQQQINAFATCVHTQTHLMSNPDQPTSSHASRYFELYNPHGFIEIAHTSRYSHRTGKSELCILATRHLAAGTVITELKGSMANLTDEEDKELKRTDLRSSDIRRDFSVIHSKQMKKNHLFLGPARFVNHDCDNNCELFREGRYITFRTRRSISIGEEITAHYGDGYFGRKNRHCLCETCEKRGTGGYSPENDDDPQPSSDSDSDSDSDSSSSDSDDEKPQAAPDLNVNERRTRRGVYAIVTVKEDDSDDSDEEEVNAIAMEGESSTIANAQIELMAERDTPSDLTSLATSVGPCDTVHETPSSSALVTPTPEHVPLSSSPLSSPVTIQEPQSSPSFRSIIFTRRQKAAAEAEAATQLVSPPLTEDNVSISETTTPKKRTLRSASIQEVAAQKQWKGKAKDDPTKSVSTSRASTAKKDNVTIKKEEVEPRTLRVRPQLTALHDAIKDSPTKSEVPKGPDGKPLPTCSTCSNILPVISVDSQVVWGLVETLKGTPKKKKAEPQECPRCMRHAAIYGRPWPYRVQIQGAIPFPPTPREDNAPESASSRVLNKSLSVLDRKLAAVASTSQKRHAHDRGENERPTKRQKTEPTQIERSTQVSNNTISKKPSWDPAPMEPPSEKRKRGRPRLNRDASGLPIRTPPRPPSAPGAQPRDVNGRFEKKTPSSPKKEDSVTLSSRAERAMERDRVKAQSEHSPDSDATSRKRTIDDLDLQELPSKRPYHRREPPKRAIPRQTSTIFKQLFSNPNPYSFARRAWGGPVTFDDSSEDEKEPVTPEDVQSSSATIDVADIDLTSLPISLPRSASIFKPSPFTFAKRRWTSSCDSKTSPGDAQLRSPRIGVRPSRKSEIGLIYSSDEEFISCQLNAVIDESEVSSDDEQNLRMLRHSYPETFPTQTLSFPKSFATTGPIPSFIRAGWDSYSSDSDS
ncbi:hypothetical protein H0H93_002782 [Arthromyces matolae]|nr:hypothetical protein H0H93_002782 [Arthromyces matolae]